jgi:hypothetical protein
MSHINTSAAFNDGLSDMDRVFLEKLRLAANVILELGEDPDVLPSPLEVELNLFKDRVERVLLMPGTSGNSPDAGQAL